MRFSKEIKHLFKAAKVARFPVGLSEIRQIIKHYGWEIYSYSEATDIIESCGLKNMAESNDAFAANVGNRIVIFYDDHISQLDFPHILAHEIGHIVLGHLNNIEDVYAKERDCDCFADELLSYVPRRIFPIAGITAAVLMFVGIFGYFSADRSKSNDPFIENSSYNKISINSTASIDSSPNVVYITKFDNKYHIIGCWYIAEKDVLIEISIDEAEQTGHNPCDVCMEE